MSEALLPCPFCGEANEIYDFMAQLGFIPIVGESDIKALEMIWRGEL